MIVATDIIGMFLLYPRDLLCHQAFVTQAMIMAPLHVPWEHIKTEIMSFSGTECEQLKFKSPGTCFIDDLSNGEIHPAYFL